MKTGSRYVLRWVGLLLFVVSAQAQVQLQVQFPLGSNLSPYLSEWERNEAQIRILVINPTPEPLEGLTLGGQLTREGGQVLARIRDQHPSLPRFDLPAGGAVSLSWREAVALDAIDYDEAEAERVATSGALPEGGYELCLWVVSADGQRLGETIPCPHFAVVLPDPPVLLEPVGGTVVNVMQRPPVFRWTPATPQFAASAYRLVIKPRFEGQTPEQAMSENPLLFTTEVAATSYPYLPTDPDLLTYPDAVDLVWRVQHVVNGQPMGRNDGWSTIESFRPVGAEEPDTSNAAASVQFAGMLHFRVNLLDLYRGTLELRGQLPGGTPSTQEVKGERAVIYEVKMVPGSDGRPQIQIQSRRFSTTSNGIKARHDVAMNAIRNMRARQTNDTGNNTSSEGSGNESEARSASPFRESDIYAIIESESRTANPGTPPTLHLVLFEFRLPDTLSRDEFMELIEGLQKDFERVGPPRPQEGDNMIRLQARSVSSVIGQSHSLLEIDFDATGRVHGGSHSLLEIDFDATGRQGGDPPGVPFPCPGLPIPPGSPGPTSPTDCIPALPYRIEAGNRLVRDAGLTDLFAPEQSSARMDNEASSIFGIAEGEYNERKMWDRILPPEPPTVDPGMPSETQRTSRPVLSLLVFGDAGAGWFRTTGEIKDNLGKGRGVRTIGFMVEGTFQPSRIWLPFPTTIQMNLQPESRTGGDGSSIFGIAEGEYNERRMWFRLAPPKPPTTDPGQPSGTQRMDNEASSIFGIAEGEYNERKMWDRRAPVPPVWGFVSKDALYLAIVVQE
ncbi:hypothetical protein [Rhodothermus marinus]|uniref:Uncharacterized protein n=1 Tax=Rhodothermus marinus (strain ATCC 43812 / DSM 4252 / R-10) TaxID=518766 RepID=D0MKB1_RHOM4|nr:hypothetical protein [Rhodothermus marinus]ACY48823.1 hypothetical protein Rmar_1940 [Rhodothermus marinus DSM 4252]